MDTTDSLAAQNASLPVNQQIINAAETDDVEKLQQFYQQFPMDVLWNPRRTNGRYKADGTGKPYSCYRNFIDYIEIDHELVRTAAEHGSTKTLEWLKTLETAKQITLCWSLGCRCALREAAAQECLVSLEWLRNNGLATREDCCHNDCYVLCRAAAEGKMGTLRWLQRNDAARLSDCEENMSKALRKSAENERTEVMDWLKEIGAATPRHCRALQSVIFRAAAGAKRMATLKWLQANDALGREDCLAKYSEALTFAIDNGDTDLLQWLVEIGAAAVGECIHAYVYTKKWSVYDINTQSAQELGDYVLNCKNVVAWLAQQDDVTERHFAMQWEKDIWWRVQRRQGWRRNMLLLVLVGRKQKGRRLPPELWELIHIFCDN